MFIIFCWYMLNKLRWLRCDILTKKSSLNGGAMSSFSSAPVLLLQSPVSEHCFLAFLRFGHSWRDLLISHFRPPASGHIGFFCVFTSMVASGSATLGEASCVDFWPTDGRLSGSVTPERLPSSSVVPEILLVSLVIRRFANFAESL